MKLTSTILISLPLLMGGFVQFIISQFYQKFATDALLLESAVVGSIFFISRVSDAVLDPVCGYLSDRLRSRRAFIFLGLIALALGTYTAFLPALFETAPLALRYAFAACGIFILYLGVTLVYIPHYAWLAALYRTTKAPLFAARAVIENFGTILGGAALALLVPYQTSVTGKGGSLLTTLGIMLVGLLLLGIFPLLLYKSTVDDTPSIPSFFHSMKTLLKNKRFTFVSLMSFFNQFAATTLLAVSLYYSDYVLHNKELGVTMTIVFLLSATIFVPLWSYLTRHFSRYTLWSLALLIIVAMSPTLLLAENGFAQYVIVFAFVAGAAAGAVLLFVPQEISEATGATEGDAGGGLYFAAFTFVNKSAMACAPLAIGIALSLARYNPQTRETDVSHTITFLFVGLPALAFFLSWVLLKLYVKHTP